MSTVTVEEELRAADSIEAAWVTWIAALQPWERRTVFAHELEWHDLFCSGEWGWADLSAALSELLR